MSRIDGRAPTDLRPIRLETGYIEHHPGSVLVSFGRTRVLCVCTVEDRVPPFRLSGGGGWMTASYSMLPGSTHDRKAREIDRGKADGRSVEIGRLIGRVIRNAVAIDRLGQRTLHLDCDVIQADGGTRTAAITGGWLAVRLCLEHLVRDSKKNLPVRKVEKLLQSQVAAVSLGVKKGVVLTDLCYEEDVSADTDLNLVGRSDGRIVEVQGTAEGAPMARDELDLLIDQGLEGIQQLCGLQLRALEEALT